MINKSGRWWRGNDFEDLADYVREYTTGAQARTARFDASCSWFRHLTASRVVDLAVAARSSPRVNLHEPAGLFSGRVATVDDDLDPAAYEQLTGISKRDYERRLLRSAQSSMMGEWTVEPDNGPAYTRIGVLDAGSVDSVSLDGEHTDVALVVMFRSDGRPDCHFGWRIPVWPAPAPDDPEMGTPEGCAFILSINLIEIFEAHPAFRPATPTRKA